MKHSTHIECIILKKNNISLNSKYLFKIKPINNIIYLFIIETYFFILKIILTIFLFRREQKIITFRVTFLYSIHQDYDSIGFLN